MAAKKRQGRPVPSSKESRSKAAARAPPRQRPAVVVKVRVLPHAEDLPLPAYETPLSAGMDLRAAITKKLKLGKGKQALVPTGLTIALPEGYEAQVRPRSGLAARYGITCLNTPGTIDADYRGEIQVLLINHGAEPFTIRRGERIAQMIIAPVTRAAWSEVETLPASRRGTDGFGSTGKR
jgi:dUTP pyrophosphatase